MRRAILLAALLAAPAAGQTAGAPGQTVVVTGQRLQDFRDRLAACLARRCPTNEDADATLALAEALFLNGDYREARDTVQASLRRNSRQARAFPEPVSDLYRAHARLSRHLGFDQDGRRSTYGVLRALRQGLPDEDHRHFTARLEVADLLIQTANFPSARRELRALAQIARRAGREDVAIIAELRLLAIDEIIHPRGEARRRLIEMSRLTGPGDRMRATGARLLLARLYRDEGDIQRADAMIAEIARSIAAAGGRRRLLHAPRFELQVRGTGELLDIPDNFEDKWVDVGFWIMPDGRVAGLELLRHRTNADWAAPLLRSIRGRRYSEGQEPTYRLERYTYTSGFGRATRTRIPVRGGRARIEYLDLTTDQDEPGPPPGVEPSPPG